jgi:hypothetical protein
MMLPNSNGYFENEWYVDYIRHMEASEILPGATEYLQNIRAKGVKTALESASKNASLILKRLMATSLTFWIKREICFGIGRCPSWLAMRSSNARFSVFKS